MCLNHLTASAAKIEKILVCHPLTKLLFFYNAVLVVVSPHCTWTLSHPRWWRWTRSPVWVNQPWIDYSERGSSVGSMGLTVSDRMERDRARVVYCIIMWYTFLSCNLICCESKFYRKRHVCSQLRVLQQITICILHGSLHSAAFFCPTESHTMT